MKSYIEFAMVPKEEDRSLWNESCQLCFGKVDLDNVDTDDLEQWLRHSMRHSGVSSNVNFTVRTQSHFIMLMHVYDYLNSLGLISGMIMTQNMINFNELREIE